MAPEKSAQPRAASREVQPQYRNTGHASARLGGPEDGKVTMLRSPKSSQELARELEAKAPSGDRYEELGRAIEAGNPKLAGADSTTVWSPGGMVREARKHLGSTAYRKKGVAKDDFPSGSPKCNKFVYDVATHSGAKVPKFDGGGYIGHEMRPPVAKTWRNEGKKIENWVVVEDPRPGDVASDGGHVGIVSGENSTVSAASRDHGNAVVENDWGFRPGQKIVFRRYVGPRW